MFGPLAGSTIENVHFIKNIENKRRLYEKLRLETGPRATVEAVKTFSAREHHFGYKSRRMDFKPDDSVGRFNVPPGCVSFKETRRNK